MDRKVGPCLSTVSKRENQDRQRDVSLSDRRMKEMEENEQSRGNSSSFCTTVSGCSAAEVKVSQR